MVIYIILLYISTYVDYCISMANEHITKLSPSPALPHHNILNTHTTLHICQFCCPYPDKAVWGLQCYSHYFFFCVKYGLNSQVFALLGDRRTKHFIKSHLYYFLSRILIMQNVFSTSFTNQLGTTAYQILSKSIDKFERKSAMFFLSLPTVTLNKGQGHSNWNKNVEFHDVCYHTKLENNPTENVTMQTNIHTPLK